MESRSSRYRTPGGHRVLVLCDVESKCAAGKRAPGGCACACACAQRSGAIDVPLRVSDWHSRSNNISCENLKDQTAFPSIFTAQT
jgi:hypothetical protein